MNEPLKEKFTLKRKREKKREEERQGLRPRGGHPYPHHFFEALP